MGFIIVWRNSHKEPHIDIDSHEFKEEYSDHKSAKEAAEEIERSENAGEKSLWYFDYKIYKESN